MKILPVNNYYNAENPTKQQIYSTRNLNSNPEKNYVTNLNLLNKNYNQINFKSISIEALEMLQKIPLEDRLAQTFQRFVHGDLILVGEKLDVAKQRMLGSLANLDNAVKRVLYIPDINLKGYLAFSRNKEGLRQVINLNENNISLIDRNTGAVEKLPPKESFYVIDGDYVGVEDTKIKIKDAPKADLSLFEKSFCLTRNFEKDINKELEKLNKKTISQLTKDIKTRSSSVTFQDVGGQDALIDDLKKSVLYPLKYPEAFENFDINRGFILYGPPGTGKTHIARALANEAGVNFVSLNGTEMESKWVGESEANWRNLFEDAKQNQPTIIFIDEIDAIAKERGGVDVYGDKVVNQILTLMTDLDNNNENVFVIGATNNFKALDKALIRSGRFSKHLEVKMPDLNGTKQILDIHSSNKPIDENIDKEALAKRLFDLHTSGADIKYIVNEAHALGYTRAQIYEKMENGDLSSKDLDEFRITQEDFDGAIKKFMETRNGTGRKAVGFSMS